MFVWTRRDVSASLIGLAALASGRGAAAETWPARPVTLVVPFPAGASTDVLARLLGETLRTELGQAFVVENKTGAGGNLAALSVARAAPDGYTLFVSSSGPLATNKLLYRKLPYDPLTDFAPVAFLGEVPLVVAAHPSIGVSSFPELIAFARANPGKVTFGSPGVGLMGHLAGELIQRKTGVRFTHVPYRGSTPLSTDLLGGVVNIAVDFLTTYIPLVRSGGVRAFAVTSETRTTQLPDVPTLSEVGLPGVTATAWFAVAGPKGLPEPVASRVASIVTAYVNSPGARDKLDALGVKPLGSGPEAVRQAQAQDLAKWGDIVRDAGIALD